MWIAVNWSDLSRDQGLLSHLLELFESRICFRKQQLQLPPIPRNQFWQFAANRE